MTGGTARHQLGLSSQGSESRLEPWSPPAALHLSSLLLPLLLFVALSLFPLSCILPLLACFFSFFFQGSISLSCFIFFFSFSSRFSPSVFCLFLISFYIFLLPSFSSPYPVSHEIPPPHFLSHYLIILYLYVRSFNFILVPRNKSPSLLQTHKYLSLIILT